MSAVLQVKSRELLGIPRNKNFIIEERGYIRKKLITQEPTSEQFELE